MCYLYLCTICYLQHCINKMATGGEMSLKICDITSCSICLETFKEPKVLPCIHTFCLECLDKYCEEKDPGKGATCPLCRKVFSLSCGGVKNLPNNFFIHQLLQFNSAAITTGAQKSDKSILCEWCSDTDVEIPATSYCIECDQHICDRCTAVHRKQKVSSSHQVVSDGDIRSSEVKSKIEMSYCDRHLSEQNSL